MFVNIQWFGILVYKQFRIYDYDFSTASPHYLKLSNLLFTNFSFCNLSLLRKNITAYNSMHVKKMPPLD